MPTFTTLRSTLALLALPLLLSGCMSLGGDANVVVYSPQLSVTPRADWPAVTWPLTVNKPVASDALDSPRIAVRPEPGTLQVYEGAIWSDPAPDLLQSALVRAFEDSGKIVSVGRQGSGLRSDFALLLDMRRFEAAYGDPKQAPSVVIELQAKLLAHPSGRVLAAKTFRAEAPASDAKVPAVMAAFDVAMTKSVSDIVGWTLATGQANAQNVEADR